MSTVRRISLIISHSSVSDRYFRIFRTTGKSVNSSLHHTLRNTYHGIRCRHSGHGSDTCLPGNINRTNIRICLIYHYRLDSHRSAVRSQLILIRNRRIIYFESTVVVARYFKAIVSQIFEVERQRVFIIRRFRHTECTCRVFQMSFRNFDSFFIIRIIISKLKSQIRSCYIYLLSVQSCIRNKKTYVICIYIIQICSR